MDGRHHVAEHPDSAFVRCPAVGEPPTSGCLASHEHRLQVEAASDAIRFANKLVRFGKVPAVGEKASEMRAEHRPSGLVTKFLCDIDAMSELRCGGIEEPYDIVEKDTSSRNV